jgi:thioesterase domain-containing protein
MPVDGVEPLKTNIEFANHLIREIKKIQPTGPYTLCGYSLGGFLAYETARQLHLRGDSIEHTFVIDTFFLHPPPNFQFSDSRLKWIMKMVKKNGWDYLKYFFRSLVTLHLLRRLGFLQGENHDWIREEDKFTEGTPRLDCPELDYDPESKPIELNLHLFVSRENNYTRLGHDLVNRWNTLTTDPITVSMIPCDYHLRIMDDEHLALIASEMRGSLSKNNNA